jgi:hypothetical protein
MASDAVDVGVGITVVFGTSGFTANITDITLPDQSRESLPTSHQGTTNWMDFTPADLSDAGQFDITGHFNPDTTIPLTSAAETITITWPSTATWAFSGFMISHSGDATLNEVMTFSATIKITGSITITAASSGS